MIVWNNWFYMWDVVDVGVLVVIVDGSVIWSDGRRVKLVVFGWEVLGIEDVVVGLLWCGGLRRVCMWCICGEECELRVVLDVDDEVNGGLENGLEEDIVWGNRKRRRSFIVDGLLIEFDLIWLS